MKAILEFDLPDDQDEFTMATKASKYWVALWDISQRYRSKLKHEQLSESEYLLIEAERDAFFEILEGHGINLNEIS
jgi:hypothetical protein